MSAGRRRGGLSGPGWPGALWVLPPLAVVLGLFGYPLALVIRQSFEPGRGASGWDSILGSAEFRQAAWRTFALALGTTAGCLLLGTFLALVIAFVPFPGARTVSRLIDTMLAFPSFLIALAFTFLYGSAGVFHAGGFLYSFWGVLFAEITFYTPFVLRPALAAFGQVPGAQLDAAASLGAGPWRVVRQVVLPEAAPALVAGACLTMLLAMNEFGIVLFIGAKDVLTLPVLIYTKGIVTFDYPGACVIAVVQVASALALYGLHHWISGKGGNGAAVGKA
ncbi:2-aminoethylphosphonate ABC transporter permease subunit [Amycolatopsis cynarae]|uniref:2-aminoethylphosphonate ABC transporter permease subunit n=1 Tax=Amycolatopsis cynarae TaxID=2995223 RepID=A0ABY7AVV2_9PSEU|nr:2-aminoethylphosphonate ABC transporter permease subunit [Amycolatopsis sp. HUAS 11-8]WAL64135.1 2-aminoethylphosphonate ABC transporter permease subunit [Amycolatopsis sp. HUAS 11-8]